MSEITVQASHYLRVLVVDDYLDHAESIARLLRLDGHEVAIACNGKQALETARANAPQVVLLGMSMPELNGWRIAKELQASLPHKPLLVAITSYNADEDCQGLRDFGFDHHFVKPADPFLVQTLLRQYARSCTSLAS